jgi:CRP-like cAMP-binding protein
VAKDALGALSGAVPDSIASSGVRSKARVTGPRSDHPIGRRGADLLAGVPLFAELSRRHLRQLAEHADVVAFREREPIVEAGQPGGTFYVILEGEARASRGGRTIGRMRPGDFFGEISLLDGGPRTATVTAETPVTTIRIFKRSFDRVVASEPAVASKILQVVARRLREAERPINN